MDAELLTTHKYVRKDNTPYVDKHLPKESFVLFDTYKLKDTEVVWINKALTQEYEIELDDNAIKSELIENFSYVSKGCTGQVQQDTFFREFSNSIGDRSWFAECSLSRL